MKYDKLGPLSDSTAHGYQAALGTAAFNDEDPGSTGLRKDGNKCYKCDSDVDPGAWTEYARGARCQLCLDVGTTDTVEYDVKPGWCVIDDNVIPGSIVGLPGSKQEFSDRAPGSAGALPATAPHSAYLTAIADTIDEFDCVPDGMWHHQQLQLPAPAARTTPWPTDRGSKGSFSVSVVTQSVIDGWNVDESIGWVTSPFWTPGGATSPAYAVPS